MKIKALDPDRLYFTSDSHFGHENIIKYCSRPFKSVSEMDEELILRWNKMVPANGIVIHAGDFTFKSRRDILEYRSRLNGTIYITPGNHDNYKELVKAGAFQGIQGLFDISVADPEIEDMQRITICHYPMISWNQSHRGAWQFFGHHHGSYTPEKIVQIDIGVDNFDYAPVSYQKLKEIITKKAVKK